MDEEIFYGSTRARISIDGAWLTSLSDENGYILFPKRQLATDDGSVKTRGGMHVCLPNFGPGEGSGLAQHGFGRTSLWEMTKTTETSLTLALHGGAVGYETLESQLTYRLDAARLTVELQLTNTGTTSLSVAPGFHPYFALLSNEEAVMVSKREYRLDEIGGTEFVTADGLTLRSIARTIRLTSDNLQVWAIWSDQLDNYVCVEPTAAGNAFVGGEPTELEPSQTATYALSINW